MSPRAAWRLEALGFGEVYDYEAGKVDWLAYRLPSEGADAAIPRAGDRARRDVPTCAITDDLAAVRARVRGAGWDSCLVVTDDRVVVGRLGRRALAENAVGSVEAAMTSGPSTVRPDARLDELLERMRRQELASLPVTTPDGRLVGLLLRSDLE